MNEYEVVGAPFVVSPRTEMDEEDSILAASESAARQEKQLAALDAFDEKEASVSPRPSSSRVFRPPTRPALKTESYQGKPYKLAFYTDEGGNEYMKSALKCDEGHVPIYNNSIPFILYDDIPSKACQTNGINQYLSWNSDKSKYCCQPEPDSNNIMMERCKQMILNMLSSVRIDSKTLPYFNYVVKKYLKYHSRVHPDLSPEVERQKMIELRNIFMENLTPGHEVKSARAERVVPMTSAHANEMWEAIHARLPTSTPPEGGKPKSRKSKSRKPKSRKPKSRKPTKKRH